MAENPLLPDSELRRLHVLLKAATRLDTARQRDALSAGRQSRSALPGKPALLAGTLLQLQGGDTLLGPANDTLPFALLDKRELTGANDVSTMRVSNAHASLATAASLAWSSKRQKTDRVVLAVLSAGASDAGWRDALLWAQAEQLPLIVACADPSGLAAFQLEPEPSQETLTWTSLQKAAAKAELPVLTVDGDDAVAVYRVMQESLLRARWGGGPAVLWAALAAERSGKGQEKVETPLARLERFLRSRKISLRSRT